MLRTLKYLMFSLVLIAAALPFASSQNMDPALGKWKLNLAKSKYDPGPAPKSETRTLEDRGDGVLHFTAEGVDGQGKRAFGQFAAKYDGKDYPLLSLGSQTAGSISLKRIDAYTIESVQKEDGKVTLRNHRTISKDGKTMTLTTQGTTAQGQKVNNVQIFDKQ